MQKFCQASQMRCNKIDLAGSLWDHLENLDCSVPMQPAALGFDQGKQTIPTHPRTSSYIGTQDTLLPESVAWLESQRELLGRTPLPENGLGMRGEPAMNEADTYQLLQTGLLDSVKHVVKAVTSEDIRIVRNCGTLLTRC